MPTKIASYVPEKVAKETYYSSQAEGERNGLDNVVEDDTIQASNYCKRLLKASDVIKNRLGKKFEVIRNRDKAKIIWTMVEEVHPSSPPKQGSKIYGVESA